MEEGRTTTLGLDRIGLLLGPLALLGWLFFADVGLSAEGHRLAGILLLTIIWWITEPIPVAATGLFAVALCVILGAMPEKIGARNVLAPFADPSAFFLLGGLFIGRAMSRHGLDRRLALGILCQPWTGRSPATLLLALGVAVALISMWTSNTAATAMVFPICLGILAELDTGESGDFPRSPYASMLLLMTAFASSAGGVATPIGTGTNVLAMGLFRRAEFFGQSLDFFQWCLVGVPLACILLIGLFLWLRWLAPAGTLDLPALREYLQHQRASLGPWRQGEINTLIVFLIVVSLWIMPGLLALLDLDPEDWFQKHFPEGIVALLAPVLLFLLPVNWGERRFSLEPEDFLKVDWGTFLLFGSGLALGTLMFSTGLANSMGKGVVKLLHEPDLWTVTALAIAGGILLSQVTSNAAAAAALIPVVFGICNEMKLEPVPPLLGLTFACSFGSALPVSTPPNAIVYGSRLLPMRRMIVAGVGFDLLCGVL
ncbi:MAG: DASS family sodium-coupled anion symporter, partial [Gemmataceae bacterium]